MFKKRHLATLILPAVVFVLLVEWHRDMLLKQEVPGLDDANVKG
jgi:hypothetical protein